MTEIELGYGRDSFTFAYDDEHFRVLAPDATGKAPLSDAEVGAALDDPIESPPLEDLLAPGESVLIIVSDATRATASAQIVHLLVRRLVQLGIAAHDLAVIFATGIHRAVTQQERGELLTSFIVQRIKILDHDAYDLTSMVRLGE